MNPKKLIVDDLLTTYYEAGQGTTVLLLHGWGDNAKTFQQLMQALSAKYRVVALDLPGFGQTDSPEQAWTLDTYAGFVQHFLAKLTVTDLLAIVGHSNGGAIAVRGASSGTLRPRKLVLLASAGVRSEYKGRKKALRIAARGAKFITRPLPKLVQQKLKKGAYKAVGSDMFVAEHLQETFKNIVTDDVQADAQKITQPTLLVYADHDNATPTDYGQLLAKALPNHQFEILPGGHFIHHDQSEQVNKLVGEFLA